MPDVAVPLPPTDTVTVRATEWADEAAVTVTVVAPSASLTFVGFTDSVTCGPP